MERHYPDGTEPDVLPHWKGCDGPCEQGRKPCPCPLACEKPHQADDLNALESVLKLVIMALALMGVAAVLAAFAWR